VEFSEKALPELLPWRKEGSAGVYLDGRMHDVRANFFGVETSTVPSTIYLHDIKIFRVKKTTETDFESAQEGYLKLNSLVYIII